MEPTTISIAARALRSRLASLVPLDEGHIYIGHPASASREAEGKVGKQFLNLFFFRIEHSGYPADALSSDPVYVRLHCLVTAYGNDDASGRGGASAGENDLRLIGGAMAALHAQPTLTVENEANEAIAALQIVPIPMSLEDLNHVWSNQGAIAYRPSVAYELALAPIPFSISAGPGPLVGAVGVHVDPHVDPMSGDGHVAIPWQPEISFSVDDEPVYTLVFSSTELPETVAVRVVGPPGEKVVLKWDHWSAATGWQTADSSDDTEITIARNDAGRYAVHDVKTRSPDPATCAWQFLLSAYGSWVDPTTGKTVALRSNVLLVSAYPGERP